MQLDTILVLIALVLACLIWPQAIPIAVAVVVMMGIVTLIVDVVKGLLK